MFDQSQHTSADFLCQCPNTESSPKRRRKAHYAKAPVVLANVARAPISDSTAARKRERGSILRLLLAARGQWVPLSKISACAKFWGVCVHELRVMGFRIESRNVEERAGSLRLLVGIDAHLAPAADRAEEVRF
jgi:hypothetical protein